MSHNGNISAIPWYPPKHAWAQIEAYRWCKDGLCVPCPVEVYQYGESYEILQYGYFYAGLAACVANLALLICYAVLPAKKTTRNMYTTGILVANVVFAAGFMFGRTDDSLSSTICYDSITKAAGLRVTRCAISGMMIVYGFLCGRLWLLFWVINMHSTVVRSKTFCDTRPWIPIVIAYTIPMIFALASLPTLENANLPLCLPQVGLPLLLILEFPMAFIDAGVTVLQFWTFLRVLITLIKVRHSKSIPSKFIGLAGIGGEVTEVDHSTKIRDIPVVRALCMLSRPITYTQLLLVNTIFMAVVFFGIRPPYNEDHNLSRQWKPAITPWLQCIVENPGNIKTCTAGFHGIYAWQLFTFTAFFLQFMAILFVVLCLRVETFVALKDLFIEIYTKLACAPSYDANIDDNDHRRSEVYTEPAQNTFMKLWQITTIRGSFSSGNASNRVQSEVNDARASMKQSSIVNQEGKSWTNKFMSSTRLGLSKLRWHRQTCHSLAAQTCCSDSLTPKLSLASHLDGTFVSRRIESGKDESNAYSPRRSEPMVLAAMQYDNTDHALQEEADEEGKGVLHMTERREGSGHRWSMDSEILPVD